MSKYNMWVEDADGVVSVSVEAVFNKLGGVEGARKLLRGELVVSHMKRNWREENGVIRFSVTSDGTDGETWITRLESKGLWVGAYAKQVLRSPSFVLTNGVPTEIAVLRGCLFEDNDRVPSKIRAFAQGRKLTAPNAEVACLIREMFTDEEIEEMGLRHIVVMHEPINGGPGLLCASRGRGGRRLDGCHRQPLFGWDRDVGFAFEVPKKQ